MPKIKTNKSASKRFSKTGTGKMTRNKAFRRHLLEHKSSKTSRNLRKKALVFKGDVERIQRLLPNL